MKKIILILTTVLFSFNINAQSPNQTNMYGVSAYYKMGPNQYKGFGASVYNVISYLGIYGHVYGNGAEVVSDYDAAYPGDALISTEVSDKQWKTFSVGLNFQVYKNFYVYYGYCDGTYYISTSKTYYDELLILKPTGYYHVGNSLKKSNAAVEFGCEYHLDFMTNNDAFRIMPMARFGYNNSMNTPVFDLGVSFFIGKGSN